MRKLGPVTVALCLVAAAALIRFYKLGDWPFAGDEIATLAETRALFDPASARADSQIFRMPRAIPVSYLINRVAYALFGWNEYGSRVVSALAGAGLAGVAFLLGAIVFGRRTAAVLSMLVALSAAHILQSQTNRFYSLTALFAGVAMLAGSVAVARPGLWWIGLSAAAALLAAFTHTVTAILLPVVLVGFLFGIGASRHAEARLVSRRAFAIFAGAAIVLGAVLVVHVMPLLQGWNRGWAYEPVHSMLAAVNMVGWPMSLLAALGLVLMIEARAAQRWYWTSCLAGWAATAVVLPLVTTYHPWYSFPFALSVLACAAYATNDIYERLGHARPAAGLVWLAVVAGLNVPGVASHFVDGSRADMRTAARYVSAHRTPGDAVVAAPLGTLRYYAPGAEPAFGMPRDGTAAVETVERLAAEHARLWVAIESGRSGPPAPLQRWLFANGSHRLHVSRQRFDYFEYALDVYVVERPSGGGTAVTER